MSYDVNDLEFFFHCLRNVKVSQGYSSNIKSLVSVTDIKLVGEIDSSPIPLSGLDVFDWVKNISSMYGKTQKKDGSHNNIWKKRSIFFDLPYWCDLHVRHCLDVMHVEKNVCDSLVGTLLNIKGKTKDGLKCCQDLVEMDIRQQLHPVSKGLRTYLLLECHTMSMT